MKLKAQNLRKLVARVITLVMLVALLPNVFLQDVQAVEKEDAGYEIYPIPQSIEYNDGTLKLGNDVNVIFEEGIDDATKNILIEVLAIKGISYEVTTEVKSDKTNFLVGLHNSNGIVDNYFTENNLNDNAHFDNFDSHIVSVKDNVVAVLGKDTDAAFYGITTLKLIFKQLNGSEIRNLLIKDFSDGQWRGFVEGYYGIPWSNENRKSLIEFGGDFKMNAYIFAPKDDQYHSLKWRDLYPNEKLAEIKELVDVGIATKNEFIWTIHPFLKDGMDLSTEENYKAELEKISAKFEQLYSIGVRQFGVLADDAEGDEKNQVKLMNDLEEWRLSKKDVKNLIFVPKVYTKESAGGDVNDINSKRLLMGKGEMLDPEVNNFKGIVTNPMQEAQASKVALFAIADYGWNIADFDMDKSWKDSFKYIDEDAADELYTFAKHMSDPSPNWHGLALEESKEISPILEEFRRKLFAGESILEYSKVVLDEYQEILDAINNFA